MQVLLKAPWDWADLTGVKMNADDKQLLWYTCVCVCVCVYIHIYIYIYDMYIYINERR
jgi:hypothetical protein